MASGYLKPHPSLAELVSDPTPSFFFSPRNELCLFHDVPTHLSLEDVAREEIRVAGMRFNGPLRSASRVRWSSWAKIRAIKSILESGRVDESNDVVVKVPEGTRMRMFEFSKTNKYLAFLVDGKTQTELWVADVKTGESKRLATNVNSVLMRPFRWYHNTLLVATVPKQYRGDPPKAPSIPSSPIIKEHDGGKAAPARTYHDLLSTDHDEKVFEHFSTTRLILVDVASGHFNDLGTEGLFSSVDISPDGCHLLGKKFVRPYSRSLPVSRFSQDISVLQLGAALDCWTPKAGLEEFSFAVVPCQEDMSTSFDARPRGPRSAEFAWNEPHTVVYIQAIDGGEPTNPADENGNRDSVWFSREAPFNDTKKHVCIFAGQLRVENVLWSDEGICLVEESWYKTRQENMFVVDPRKGDANKRLLYTRSSDDAYSSWGSPRMEYVPDTGRWRMKRRPSDNAIMFVGAGATPNGSRPFLDYVNIITGVKERIWRSAPVLEPKIPEDPTQEPFGKIVDASKRKGVFERAVDVIWTQTDGMKVTESWLIVVTESPMSPPNVTLRSLEDPDNPFKCIALTSFPNPQPSLMGVKKELVRYSRPDGVELSATLYLPPDHDGTTRLPLLCWAYPLEFKSKEFASQVKTSPYKFNHTHWSRPLLWVARGWAVLDDFSVPIVGVGEAEPNDTFIEQLVSSAEAAVNECVNRGVADIDRVAIGGHSYGAFMAVHLLAHTRLFKGAIARSGAYNRLLTPFSYQAEERTFWQAPQMYIRNSPFTHADKIEDPVLLIHGSDDPNPGTHSLQTERLYAALQGLGKRVRSVILPCERHSYDAIESVLHVVAEQDNFLVKYVLNSKDVEENKVKRAKI